MTKLLIWSTIFVIIVGTAFALTPSQHMLFNKKRAVAANMVPPSISGTAQVGQTLTGNRGTWRNSPTSFSYLWSRLTPPLAGAAKYVATTGSDLNAGTIGAPYLTLQKAASVAVPGTTIHVASGTYNGTTSCSTPNVSGTTMVCMTTSGTAGAPITFVSDTKWGAKLTCPSSNAFFILDASYIVMDGFEVTCPGSNYGFVGGIYGNNGHNTFKNFYVHDLTNASNSCPGTGVFFGSNTNTLANTNAGYNVWDRNIIHHIGQTTAAAPACNQLQGIYMTAPFEVATNNIVSGTPGWGIHAYGSGICNQTISNNTVFDNSQGGIVVKNSGQGPGYIDYCQNGSEAEFETVTNNIVVNNGDGQNFSGAPYTGEGGGIYFTTAFGPGVSAQNLISNNLVYGNATFQVSVLSPAVAQNTSSSTNAAVFMNYQTDNNWAPVSTYNFQNYALKTGSATINGGIATGAPTADILNASRPQGVGYDIGAFEFGMTSATYVPGVNDIGFTLTVAVTAQNRYGLSAASTSAASGTIIAASGASCPQGTALPDGCSGAVAGTPNNPTLLNTYGANRPPWNAPGVDYKVGHSGTLLDPSAGGLPACATYSGTAGAHAVTVNSSPCTVDHFDLTLNGGTCLNVGAGVSGGTVTLTNNHVRAGANCQTVGGGIVNIGGTATVILRYNTFDANYETNLSNILNVGGNGDKTIEYNVFLFPTQHTIAFQASGNYTVRYNYSLGEGANDNHGDWVVIAGTSGTTFSLNEEYNTVTIDPNTTDLGHTATAYCYMETYPDVNVPSPGLKCAHDVYISNLSVDGRGHVGYVGRIWPTTFWSSGGPFIFSDNYIDSTGSFGPLLVNSGGGNPPITCSGNKDLVTGAAITGAFGYITCN